MGLVYAYILWKPKPYTQFVNNNPSKPSKCLVLFVTNV
jgi:hypothetical protein